MDEHDAIMLLKHKDIRGLEVLVHRYQLQAIRAAYLITGDRALAEDVVQETFLRAYERIHQFDSEKPFGPWFLRSVVNEAAKVSARQRRQISLDDDHGDVRADLLEDEDLDPAATLETKSLHETVWNALESLPPTQRVVIVLRYYLNLSEQQIAEELETPPGTIKWRLHAARKQLQVLLRALQWMGGVL